jgi:DNA-binding transcriptional ArsR family regulator
MLDTLITSKTRIKLLLKFFLNGNTSSYLRNLESEFGESSNAIRLELNKFEEAGLLNTSLEGNKKLFKANTKHPLFMDIRSILMKYTGLDQIVDEVIQKLGDVELVYLCGDLAQGINSSIIDLILIGEINKTYLLSLIEKTEKIINKKIKFIIYNADEYNYQRTTLTNNSHFLLWKKD